jgi:nitrate/TMAO reductase-like tetraheme cytochrome c subunit
MKKIAVVLLVFAAFAFLTSFLSAEEKKHEYVGVDKCKICHKKDNVYPTWLETKHAKAWESLDSAAQKNPDCVGCHSTGKTAEGELLTGVQCETCHGPGSDYKSMSIMKDLAKAMENGLLIPDSTTCMNCHNDKVPEQFRPKEPYNWAKMMETGLHAMPAKAEKK